MAASTYTIAVQLVSALPGIEQNPEVCDATSA